LETRVNWRAVRSEFPALERFTYLNTATFGQMPRRSVEAVARHFAHRDETACAGFLSWFDDADVLRSDLARLIGAEASDIAFLPNASTALSLLIGGLDWRPGDRIVTLQGDFPNNTYAPLALRPEGVEVVEAPWERFCDAIAPPARLVALSEVNYTNGFRPPLEAIARRAHECGAVLYVDGTQSLGALEFDVNAAQPDLYAVHGYKWLLSPNGAAFMYVRPSLRDRLRPAVVGWRSDSGWRDVNHLNHGAPRLVSGAEKYEGGILSFALLYGMQASVGLILELGPQTIERRVMEVAEYTRAALRRLGARLPADESPYFDSPIVAARFEGRPAAELVAALKARRVLLSARHDYLRISTHFYNTEEDVDRFIAELANLL
jgi:cysteine desulfurase / selenocysteine lyase